jgi:hypothetical protein
MRRLCAALVVIGLVTVIGLRVLAIGERALSLERTDYGEGPLAAFVGRWIDHSPAPQWLEVPSTATAYGPLMSGAWRAAAIVSPHSNLLLVGRAIAVAAGAVLLVAVAVIVFADRRSAIATGTALALLLASPVTIDWFPYARVDTTAAFLTCLAYAVFGARGAGLVVSAALLVLASLAKQTAAIHVIPLAWIAYTLGGMRGTLRWVGTVAGLAAVAWALTLASYGGYFFDASITANMNHLSAWQHMEVTRVWLTAASSVLMLCAAWMWAAIEPRGAMVNRWWAGFAFSVLFASILSLKEGAWLNYFLDATWLGAIVAGCVVADALRQRPSPVVAGLALAVVLSLPALVLPRYFNGWIVKPTAFRAEAVTRLAGTGPLLLDGQLVGYVPRHPGLLANDPFLLRLRDDDGIAPTERILDQLSVPSATVILSIPLSAHIARRPRARDWPAAILQRLHTEFCLTERLPELFVYRHASNRTCLGEEPPQP